MGGLDLSRDQVNSKWKDLQKKCNAFNYIYNRKMSIVACGRSEANEWLKELKKTGEDSPPPSSKRTKTSSSNSYTTSSDPQYPPGFSPQQQ
uniref:Uncharacterized protein n=1 Tax=Lactuca sativa TaxID=4236 RepID=A0A9R1UVK7_LACSA|nr:hypothetical protein LSAT_V11C800451590 [Lactuca sativa]